MSDSFFERGWRVFPVDRPVTDWARGALIDATRALQEPALDHWYQCERTWFVGLDALSNDAQGRIDGGPAFSGTAVDFIDARLGGWPDLHAGQLSGVFPGYPKPRAGESESAFRYRVKRDAAHVDGVLGVGQPKRRFVREPHQFILGIPLTKASVGAAPLVVWEGSHLIMQRAFKTAFEGLTDCAIGDRDVTEAYQAAREEIFETCARVRVTCDPGGSILVHRLALHGVAPWETGASCAPEGRLIAYFRPPMAGGARAWVDAR